jgi:excisionase family DNA binding protein
VSDKISKQDETSSEHGADTPSSLTSGTSHVRVSFSVPEAAKMTGFGQTTIYAEIKAGQLRARKLGARTFITIEDLRAWLEGKPAIGGES